MTGPIVFGEDGDFESNEEQVMVTDLPNAEVAVKDPYPKAILNLPKERIKEFEIWARRWIEQLVSDHQSKMKEFAHNEVLYRAKTQGAKSFPFQGACGDVIPLVAMGVDPVHARLDNGIFKADPPFTVRALKKDYNEVAHSVTKFLDFYQRHRLRLRRVVSPRLLELAKHGTMVLKTIYDREKYNVQSYDADWNVVEKEVLRFAGPRVVGLSLGDFMFPAGYEDLQACPIVLERQRVTFGWLKVQEASGKLANVDKVKAETTSERTMLELEQEVAANHADTNKEGDTYYIVLEGWCDYDINGDGLPERIAFTYHYDTGTFLQLRYNWYFHQRKPYTIIPYAITNGSLYGIGIAEMDGVFQDAITQWHQMATDNAYLSNIRMFIAAKDAQIEDKPRLYAGRVFRVNDPSKDLIPFRMGDTYNSTLQERQNLFGLAEKRTGISDYLTGRESPIVGSRATATSTLALIDEGTKRVEQVMENIRAGMAEVMENCIYIWMQYGLDDIDNIVFGDDQIATDVRKFFNTLNQDNVGGAIAIDLTATDAKSNRQAKQQAQMMIIQVMMTFYQKFVELGTSAIQAVQTAPAIAMLMNDVAESARKMFRDLLIQHDVPDIEQYLPELEKYLNAAMAPPPGVGQGGGPPGSTGAPSGQPGIPGSTGLPSLPPGVQPPSADIGGPGAGNLPFAG